MNLSWLQQIDFTIYEINYHSVKYARGSVLTLENTAHLTVINFIGSIIETFKPSNLLELLSLSRMFQILISNF